MSPKNRTCNRCKVTKPLNSEFFNQNKRMAGDKTIVYLTKMCTRCLKLAKAQRESELRGLNILQNRKPDDKWLTRGTIKYEGYIGL